MNGAPAHKSIYSNSIDAVKKLGVRGLYGGFGVNLIRCIPLTLLNYLTFEATKDITRAKPEFENPVIRTKLEKFKY